MDAIRTNVIVIVTPPITRSTTKMTLHIVATKQNLNGRGGPGWPTMLIIGMRRARRTTIEFPVTINVNVPFIRSAISHVRYYRYCFFIVVIIYTSKIKLETPTNTQHRYQQSGHTPTCFGLKLNANYRAALSPAARTKYPQRIWTNSKDQQANIFAASQDQIP